MSVQETLLERKAKMIVYLQLKVQEEDWHGVADAAMDLRDIESELVGYRKGRGERIELTTKR